MSEDWKNAHLSWIAQYKNFVPKFSYDYRNDIPYIQIMKEVYGNKHCTQKMAYQFYMADKAWYKHQFELSKCMDKEIEKLEPTPNGMWFVTIGFNHQTWSVSQCCRAIEKLLAMEWIISAKANFEMFRENGQHPHCHFVIETKEPKSRILEKFFRPQYVKNVVLNRNFIDVKKCEPFHLKYILLEKQSDKMIYVEQDKMWRQQNGIPDYEKNWNID